MKLLTIIYDNGIDEAVMDEINAMQLDGWTRIFDAHGYGGAGLRRGDQIFPGTNNVLLIALPEERVPEVWRRMRRLQGTFRLKPGVTIYAQDAVELGPDPPSEAS